MKIKKYALNFAEKAIFFMEILVSPFYGEGRKYLRELRLERRDREYYKKYKRDVRGPTRADNF
jgi:hypothetical protein